MCSYAYSPWHNLIIFYDVYIGLNYCKRCRNSEIMAIKCGEGESNILMIENNFLNFYYGQITCSHIFNIEINTCISSSFNSVLFYNENKSHTNGCFIIF